MTITISPYTPGDEAELLTRGLRVGDVLEAWKVTGIPAARAVALSLEHSLMAGTIRLDGRIVSLFGVGGPEGETARDARPSAPGTGFPCLGTGFPWLVAHPEFENPAIAVPMARILRRFLDHWLTVFPRLENYTDPGHAAALRLLAWAGFSLRVATVPGPLGHRLMHFWKNSDTVGKEIPECVSI